MLPQFNAIVLDVIVVAMLLALIAVGVFKGVKHTLINIVLLVISIGVGFISYTNVVKTYIASLLVEWINIGNKVSFTPEMKIGFSLAYMFMAALILTILTYVILRLVKLIIIAIIKKREGAAKIRKSVVSRVFGGIVSFLVYGVFVIVALSLMDNPLIGLDKTVESSYVTKYVARADNMILEALDKDAEEFEGNITLIAVKGDFLDKSITPEAIKKFNDVMETLGKEPIIPNEFNEENAQQLVDKLNLILSLEEELFIDDDGIALKGFEEFIKLSNDTITKAVVKVESLHTGAKIDNINNTQSVYTKLEKVCGAIVSEKFANVFILS